MKTYEVIQTLMDVHQPKRVSRAEMARLLGASRGTVGNQLDGRNEMRVSKVLEYLDQLGYKMVLVPKGKRLAEGDYEITE